MKLFLIALTFISYNQFKTEYFSDPESEPLVKAIIKVINDTTKNGGAVVWYDPIKPKEIFSRTGKSILMGFWQKPIINPDNCVTDLKTKKYRCTGVEDELVFERIPTYIVTSQKVIFLTETLAQIKIAGGNPDKWSLFLTALSEATANNRIARINRLGCFKRHSNDDLFEFQFSQNCWRPKEEPLLVPGADHR